MVHKLSSRKGETLTETLVALLITCLASLALVTMIVAASNINATARTADENLQTGLNAAENDSEELNPQPSPAQITISDGGNSVSCNVTYYKATDSSLISYRKKVGS